MPKQTVILDSSQLSTFLECNERWRLENEERLIHIKDGKPIEETNRPNEAVSAGSLGHKYLELYYKALGLTDDLKQSAKIALEFDPDAADFQDNHEFPLSKDTRSLVRKRFCDYLMTYSSRDYMVSRKRVPSICVDENDSLFDCWKYVPLVEQGFSYKLFESAEYLFILEGRIDFIGEVNSTPLWMDHKWQFRERELYNKSIQFRNYALVTGFDLGVVNYVRLHKEVNPKTFCRQPISFSPLERRYWKEELTDIFVGFAKIQRDRSFLRDRSACGGKYGYPCEFIPICDEWSEQTREQIKKTRYTQRKEWRPW